jgi:sigma-B regulation protein RsbU (phosphoserine phosphatase)
VPLRATIADGSRSEDEARDVLIGVWALGVLRSGELPDREDLLAVARVGRQAAVLLDYARLNREQVQQALVQQDLERARQIQQRLLAPSHAGWLGEVEVAARLQPARVASGDFYDVYELAAAEVAGDNAYTRPALQVAVGDVQGKGMAAALVMAMAMAALRTAGERTAGTESASVSPAATLGLVGRQLHHGLGVSDFVCCALAIVEPTDATGRLWLRLANAGQVPPLLCRNGTVDKLIPGGDALPLGVLTNPTYREVTRELQAGDVVVFASDGLVEAPIAAGTREGVAAGSVVGDRALGSTNGPTRAAAEEAMFGFEQLDRVASEWARRAQSAEAIADGIWSALSRWCGGDFQHDDVTLVVLRVGTAGERQPA